MLKLWEMSLFGGVIVAAVVLLRAMTIHKLPKNAFLALWGVALCRLLIPFKIPSPLSLYSAAGHVAATLQPGVRVATEGETVQVAGEQLIMQGVARAQLGGELPVLLLIWLVGTVLCAFFFLITHLMSRRRYGASLPVEVPFVQDWLEQNRLRRPVQVRCSDQISAPLTYGVLWPVILLPKGLNDETWLDFVLAHEMAHIRRCDCLIKWILAAALALHWFNPLVWVLYVLANRDLELSCDETVVLRCGPQARATYALTLVGLAEQSGRFSPLSSSFSKNAMEERIKAIMKSKKTTVAGVVSAVAMVITFTVVFATTAAQRGTTPSMAASGNVVIQDKFLSFSDSDSEPQYTQAHYDKVMTLKSKGYETLSIAAFNRALHAAFEEENTAYENSMIYAYEMLMMSLPDTDPNAGFIRNTIRASKTEYDTRIEEVYANKTQNPDFYGQATRRWTADVFGDTITVGEADLGYIFYYRILDQDKLTVGERDKFLQDIMGGMLTYLDQWDPAEMKDEDAATAAAKKELDRLGAALSNSKIAYVSGKIEGFYYYRDQADYGMMEKGEAQVYSGAAYEYGHVKTATTGVVQTW